MTKTTLEHFPALVVRDGVTKVETADSSLLYQGKNTVTVKVAYSCINYKDALAITGKGKILRTSPIIPGIDYVGEALNSSGDINKGDKVVLTGYAVGEKYSGGFAAYANAKPEWLLRLPKDLDEKHAMICGTAGLTAGLCVLAIHESEQIPEGGRVVVSGASGGVGSFAVALLKDLGYHVTAISQASSKEYLKTLGADDIIEREEMMTPPHPLEKARWHGAVDCVGSTMLARILAETDYGGVVAACGLAGGYELPTTVMPFILRGVNLIGVDSVQAPRNLRRRAWELIAKNFSEMDYQHIHANTVSLSETAAACEEVLAGNNSGRILVEPVK